MIEKVKGLSICGRCFSKKTNLAFFPNDNDRIAIVYGKNGSGKSTISDGFSQIASGEDAEELSASLIELITRLVWYLKAKYLYSMKNILTKM